MSLVRFAIVGCGMISQRHAEHISNLGTLVAVCDIVESRALELARKHSCQAFRDIGELLEKCPDVDVISVCTPNALHARHSIQALRAGKHVVCEKPMALSVKDCLEMIAASSASGKHLFVVKQNRFNPPIVALKSAIDQGWLGRIVNVQLNCFWNRNAQYYTTSDWKGRLALDGGILYTQFSHFIDLILWLVGDVESFHVLADNFMHKDIIEFEDSGVVALKFRGGALGTINFTINCHKKNMEGSITVFGERGTVKVGGQYLNALEYQSIEGHEITHVAESRPANNYGSYQGSMSNHDKVFENVIAVLQKGAAIATTAQEGMKTVDLIERIYQLTRPDPGRAGSR
jgi:UDP-N-acetyl-2-amino-2-deoxyglucuronate dehydrogenase